jgi:hypothetical protein
MSKSYEELRKINVNDHIEKKNNLSYLSWAWAVDVLFQNDPEATWGYSVFDGKPWMDVNGTFMVFCTVKAFGRERTAQLPIMDYKNKAMTAFDSFHLNTTMQRCLAKAISLHGIGLYIYAGEDLPDGDAEEKKDKPEKVKAFETSHKPTDGAIEALTLDEQTVVFDLSNRVRKMGIKDVKGCCDETDETLAEFSNKNDMKIALWAHLQDLSTLRNAMKAEWTARRLAAQTSEVATQA